MTRSSCSPMRTTSSTSCTHLVDDTFLSRDRRMEAARTIATEHSSTHGQVFSSSLCGNSRVSDERRAGRQCCPHRLERWGRIGWALESIRRQSLRGIEIIVVDDASTDGTAEFVESVAVNDSRIRLLTRSENSVDVALHETMAFGWPVHPG